MLGFKINCHIINSGYGEDYGYKEMEVTEVVSLDTTPTIKVVYADRATRKNFYAYLAWYRNNEWVVDFD